MQKFLYWQNILTISFLEAHAQHALCFSLTHPTVKELGDRFSDFIFVDAKYNRDAMMWYFIGTNFRGIK